MTRRDIHFIALHGSGELNLRLLDDDPVAKRGRHLVDLCFADVQFLANLLVGKVQPHKIKAKHPITQRSVMPSENGICQVVKRFATFAAQVMLTICLHGIMAVFDDVGCVTMRTFNAFGPTKLSNLLITFRVVDDALNIQLHF